jgi:tRNA pseudouridine(38-40) synthase
MPTLVSMLNQELPSDIRAFSATKMNQGFRSRESCHFREYEYLLPIDFITASSVNSSGKSWKSSLPSNSEEVLESLNESFEQMVGSKSFHNFHKLSPKQLRPSSYGKMTMGKEEEERVRH